MVGSPIAPVAYVIEARLILRRVPPKCQTDHTRTATIRLTAGWARRADVPITTEAARCRVSIVIEIMVVVVVTRIPYA